MCAGGGRTGDGDYEAMLEAAYKQLQPRLGKEGRSQPPKPEVLLMGNQTFLQNFKAVCDHLDRDPHHVLKFLSKELATAATRKETYAVFQGRFSENQVQRLLSRYVSVFVVCPVCKLPDTRIEKHGRFYFLLCEACGAKSSVRAV